jgi:ABC-type multidrug transport system ATPase subunit
MTVSSGDLVAVIGGSGSGKTALLEALAGLHPQASGEVTRHLGRPVGYVPAGDSIDPVLPLAMALGYAAALRGMGGGTGAEEVRAALGLVGLADEASTPAGELDPGARKRAAIAAELLAGPDALFLDEPTALFDLAQASQVLRLLHDLCDAGKTVLFTTTSHLDATRCAKVAVLAAGGHLAFFGTPAAARVYFGADSLEEVYERMAGLGDPASAWSRRFYFNGTAGGAPLVPTLPRAPGPAVLVPDQAGPHSAGRPSLLGGADVGLPDSDDDLADIDGGQFPAPEQPAPARSVTPLRPARQFPVLAARHAASLARDPRRQLTMAAVPLAVAAATGVLLLAGALNGPAAVPMAWVVAGGLAVGLAYGLPARARESAILRRERHAGVSVPAFLSAKAALLLPPLAAADLLTLAVPALANRLHYGFVVSFATVLAVSAAALTAAAASSLPRRGGSAG